MGGDALNGCMGGDALNCCMGGDAMNGCTGGDTQKDLMMGEVSSLRHSLVASVAIYKARQQTLVTQPPTTQSHPITHIKFTQVSHEIPIISVLYIYIVPAEENLQRCSWPDKTRP